MKKLMISAAVAAMSIAVVAPASAAIIIDTDGLMTAENVLFDQNAGLNVTQVATTNQTNIDVTFTNALGLIADASGQSSVYNTISDGANYLLGTTTFGVGAGYFFTGTDFNLPGIPGNAPPTEAVSVFIEALDLNGAVIGSKTLSLNGNGQNRIRVFGDMGEQLSAVRLKLNPTNGGVGSLTQVRLGGAAAIAAVPEPATWAMMIGGFGLLGGVARRRRKVQVTYA